MGAIDSYCEALYELAEDDLESIRARVADRLGVSRPAVSEMVNRLEGLGLVATTERGAVVLTPAGLEIAERSVRRHRLAERLLVDVLGLGWAEAHELAATWQHVVDDRVEAAIDRLLDSPRTCPHGNPIPGRPSPEEGVRLSALEGGAIAQVQRITEQLEVAPGMLVALEQVGLIPGTRIRVLSRAPDGTRAVQAARGVISVNEHTADAIVVVPGDLSSISDAIADH
jgi:DtxR family Mn-dependent transcriptional regulator